MSWSVTVTTTERCLWSSGVSVRTYHLCRVMRHLFRLLLVISLFSVAPYSSYAQDKGISQKKQEKILAKKAVKDRKAEAKREKQGKKRHLKIQSKDVRKRLKRNTKRADRSGSNRHRDGFFRRLFGRR